MDVSLTRALPPGEGRITQKFGANPDAYRRFGLAGHNGIDYGVPVGTPVLAAHDGTVDLTGEGPDGYGLYIRLRNERIVTLYAHLDSISVSEGGMVRAGQTIGYSGNSGNSTGPHLHFELRILGMRNPAYGDRIDPVPFRDI